MRRHKLTVQHLPPANPQARHQMGQRYLAGIGAAADHRFAEKGAAQADAIKAADQFAALPTFDAMGVTQFMQLGIALVDGLVNPCAGSVIRRRRAQRHHARKTLIRCDREMIG